MLDKKVRVQSSSNGILPQTRWNLWFDSMTLEWYPALACVASLALKYVFANANKKREATLHREKGELLNAEKQRALGRRRVQFLEIELKQSGSKTHTVQKNVTLLEQVLEGFLAEERKEEDVRKHQQEQVEESRRLRQKRLEI